MPETIQIVLHFLRNKHDTQGSPGLFEMLVPPNGQMPIAHHHRDWDETAYGLEGMVTFTMNNTPTPSDLAAPCSSLAAPSTASTTAAALPPAAYAS